MPVNLHFRKNLKDHSLEAKVWVGWIRVAPTNYHDSNCHRCRIWKPAISTKWKNWYSTILIHRWLRSNSKSTTCPSTPTLKSSLITLPQFQVGLIRWWQIETNKAGWQWLQSLPRLLLTQSSWRDQDPDSKWWIIPEMSMPTRWEHTTRNLKVVMI